MIATFAPIAALLLSMAVLLTGNGLQVTLLPIRAGAEGFSTLSIGILGSAYFAGFTAGCVLGPTLIRMVGHIRCFSAMTAIATAAVLAHGLWPVAPGWWLMRAASGFCFAVLFVVIESWLNERSTKETRGLVLSVYLIIQLTVITIGQMMVTLADPKMLTLFAVAAMLVSLGAVPVALTRSIAPGLPPAVHPRLLRLYRTSPVGFVTCLGVGVANGAFWALSPAFASGIGRDAEGIALMMSAVVIGGAVGQWPLGHLSDHMDRRYVVIVACAGAIAAGAGMTFAPFESTWVLLALGAAWGAFAFPLYSLAVAHTNDHAHAGEYVEVSSGLLLLYGIGAVLGPLVIAPPLDAVGPTALFQAIIAIHVAMAAYALLRLTRRAAPPLSEHVSFDESAQAAYTVTGVFQQEEDETGKDEKSQPPS